MLASQPTTPSAYRGRFAPSPTGALHLGSLVTAVASYLDAKAHHGQWLLRIEDIDSQRCHTQYADQLMRELALHGLHWDEPVSYQQPRQQHYRHYLERLLEQDHAYACACTRKQLRALHQGRHPAHCLTPWDGQSPCSYRLRFAAGDYQFLDRHAGRQTHSVAEPGDDFIIWRRNDEVAYQLAVVVDDAEQGITHIVRGADLLSSTPYQNRLQQLLGLPTPHYLHTPLVVDQQGTKFSKQTFAPGLNLEQTSHNLWQALGYLGLQPPTALAKAPVETLLTWGTEHWLTQRLQMTQAIVLPLSLPRAPK